MNRISIKIVGAQGQGVNSVGEMCAKGLKRAGYCVFGQREYQSVIRGGHSSYQLDISNTQVRSAQEKVDLLVTFNHHGINKDLKFLKKGGVLLHQTPQWKFSEEGREFLEENNIEIIYLPTEEVLKKLEAAPILGNVLVTSVVWSILGRSDDELKSLVKERFGDKKDLLELNFRCIEKGFDFIKVNSEKLKVNSVCLSESDSEWKDQLLITGSQAMGLGTIHAGCRALFGYPMTPASPLLTFLAEKQSESKMLVKQAEDEITAVQMMVGAMHMGTRAVTATSGGGYDLMVETISLCGVSETPAVIVLAQRPGPGTGLPTWTSQGDLLMAVNSGHGEFPRLVMSVSNAEDSFSLMMEAFNYADEFQIPVTVLTEKQVAESLFTVDESHVARRTSHVSRGKLVVDESELKNLKSTNRYNPEAEGGVSKRWLPGSEAETYCAQGYEHFSDGSFDESSENTVRQVEKRIRKMEALRERLPEAELMTIDNGQLTIDNFSQNKIDILFISWGSNKNAILDAMHVAAIRKSQQSIGYLHYTYLWPLKTGKFMDLASRAKRVILVEGNAQGQLGMLIKQECGFEFEERVLRFDGRSIGFEQLERIVNSSINSKLTPAPDPSPLGGGG